MIYKKTPNTEHQVFISYAGDKGDFPVFKDHQVAEKVCSALESGGIPCWIAPRDISTGEGWLNAKLDAVEKSKVAVLAFSSITNESQWVSDEIQSALDENIKIILFRIDNVSPEGMLNVLKDRCQWVDALTPPLEKHIDKLVKMVSRHLGKEPLKPVNVNAISVKEQPEADHEKVKEPEVIPVQEVPAEKMPLDVINVADKGIRVEKNKKGSWEAYYPDGIVMVYIPAGRFIMGSNDYGKEKPPHNVYMDGYWMGKTGVTVKQYLQFVNSVNSHHPAWLEKGSKYNIETGNNDLYKRLGEAVTGDNYPIVGISWFDANAYCAWLSQKTGLKFKLSTEPQWEKAARGTDGRKYPWGDLEPDETLANFGFYVGKTTPVDLYPSGESPFGLLNMVGNVWEWCTDWYYSDYYNNSPDSNPPGPESGTLRVFRGGGWHNNTASIRCATRNDSVPSFRVNDVGFRLCIDSG